jgi:hypothetical protein
MAINDTEHKMKVFISSTSEDLKDYRAVARLTVLDVGWFPEMMEHFGAMPEATVEACYKKLVGCDLMILILAWRQGWVPAKEQGGNGEDSVTALELQFAREHQIPVLAFMADKSWPGDLWEDTDVARAWVKKFRNELNLPATFFFNEDAPEKPDFRANLKKALVDYKEELLKKQTPATTTINQQVVDSATNMVCAGHYIPILGYGVFGDGPLSKNALIQAFSLKFNEPSLATAAEYLERFLLSREEFLSRLKAIIAAQEKQLTAPSVHDLLAQVDPPPLIVSATIDLVLEKRLAQTGKPVLILCHILRSWEAEQDGKILVLKGPDDQKPDIQPADEIDLGDSKGNYIIYKPLGSPFLNGRPDPDMAIDTVAITESDHLTMFGRLKNQITGVPTAFTKFFKRFPIIFLNYPMDMWHFRMVGQVFRSINLNLKDSASLALRVPVSEMEDMAWRRLGVDLLPMDANEFARGACKIYESGKAA